MIVPLSSLTDVMLPDARIKLFRALRLILPKGASRFPWLLIEGALMLMTPPASNGVDAVPLAGSMLILPLGLSIESILRLN